ncbi:hypothetical protein FRC00_012454 [Tulasnella sp. 408]|nr:hypothetical protein FRC00_012454 [Tulasnella sp. 408]
MHRRGTPLETVQDAHDEGSDGVSPPLNDNLPSASYGTPSPTSPTLNGSRSNSMPSSGTGAPPPPYLDTYYRSSKNSFSTPSPTIASSPRSPNFDLTPPRARTASGTQAGPLRVSSPLSATATPPPPSPKLTLNSLSGRSYYTGRNGGALRENGYYPEPPATARTECGPESSDAPPARKVAIRHAIRWDERTLLNDDPFDFDAHPDDLFDLDAHPETDGAVSFKFAGRGNKWKAIVES